jgi:hypothetical protein
MKKALHKRTTAWIIASAVLLFVGVAVAQGEPSAAPATQTPAWLQTLVQKEVALNTSPQAAQPLTAEWTLTSYGNYTEAVPDNPCDPSLATKPVYVVVLKGQVQSVLASSPDGAPVTGAALVLTIDPDTQAVGSYVLLPQGKAARLTDLGPTTTVAL